MQAYLAFLIASGQVRVIQREVDPRVELAAVTNLYGNRKRLCDIAGAADGNFCLRWVELRVRIPGAGDIRLSDYTG